MAIWVLNTSLSPLLGIQYLPILKIAYFAEVLPDYDEDRVYASDIKKVLNWYNMLQAKGLVSKEAPEAKKAADKESEVADTPAKTAKTADDAPKAAAKKAAPKVKKDKE